MVDGICKKHTWRTKVELFIDIPHAFNRRVTKAVLRRRDVEIDGAQWENTYTYCQQCGTPHPDNSSRKSRLDSNWYRK